MLNTRLPLRLRPTRVQVARVTPSLERLDSPPRPDVRCAAHARRVVGCVFVNPYLYEDS